MRITPDVVAITVVDEPWKRPTRDLRQSPLTVLASPLAILTVVTPLNNKTRFKPGYLLTEKRTPIYQKIR